MRRVVAVVPSLGLAPQSGAALAALRRELAAVDGGLVWVHQGEAAPPPALTGAGERRLDLARPAGFARAANAGLAAAGAADWLALINDDCVVEPGWLAALLEAGAARPEVAALQGVQIDLARPDLADGCGLAWNRWLQAVQIGHGEPAPPAGSPPRELFGVSATAALYRARALAAVAGPGGIFDVRLDSYYEDVDLALRLAAAGWRALLVPAARARHAGSATGARAPARRLAAIYGNRWAVVARWQGRRFPLVLPRLATRDALDLAGAVAAGDGRRAAGILRGWGRALRLLPRFVRLGAPRPALAAVDRLRVVSRG